MNPLECFYRVEDIKNKNILERTFVFAEESLKCLFSLIFDLFKLYFTIPMNSVLCERSFSWL